MIASWIRRLSWLGLLLFCLGPCWAAPEVTIRPYPRTKGNTVRLRLSVTDGGKSVPNLAERYFQVLSDGKSVPIENLIPPIRSSPSPTRLVILLDVSNSMTRKDTSGKSRQEGAVEAIGAILTQFEEAPLKVNLVPFGEGGSACRWGGFVPNSVTYYLKEENFLAPDSEQLRKQLERLAKDKLCASTNIYKPLSKTIEYLMVEEERINVLENSPRDVSQLPTRFGIILISDGFHSTPRRDCGRDDEPKRFEQLAATIRQGSKITIHTLGYGLTPTELGEKWGLSGPAKVEDVICSNQRERREQEFVDQERLAEIARLGRGIHEFSGSASEISRELEESVRAFFGDYELIYVQPGAESGQINEVKVVLDLGSDPVTSEPIQVRIGTWRDKPSPLLLLLGTMVAIAGVVSGVVVFSKWSDSLKQGS